MSATYGPVDRTTLNALSPNLDVGDVADPALRLAFFQYLADYGDATYSGIQNQLSGLISAGTLSHLGLINVKDYGASGSANTYTASIAAGSRNLVLTTSSHDFVAGQGISIPGAGAAGTALFTTVSSVNGATVQVATAAITAATAVTVNHNDTDAFQAVATAVNAAGGGTIVIPPGTYNLGKQNFAGAADLGYAFQPQDVLRIENCTKPLVIVGSNAVLKADANLRFGAFDPVTGAVHNPTMPFTDADYTAHAYWGMIRITGCSSVSIKNIELDGNMDNVVLGGLWGDTGRQLGAYAFWLMDNNSLLLQNVYTHHHCLDGLMISKDIGTIDDDLIPMTLINVRSEYNARQGFSWGGGLGLTAIGCKFSHTGKGRFKSSPSAGMDVEPGTDEYAGKGTFIECEFLNNAGAGFVADGSKCSELRFRDCVFWGTTNAPIWPNVPRVRFDDCEIYGSCSSFYNATNPMDGVKFNRCRFEDREHPDYGVYRSFYLVNTAGDYIVFDGCHMVANEVQSLFLTGDRNEIRNSYLKHICSHLPTTGADFVANIGDPYIENTIFDEAFGYTPTDKFYVAVGNNYVIGNNCAIRGTHLYWSTFGAGGFNGQIPQGVAKYNTSRTQVTAGTANKWAGAGAFRAIGLMTNSFTYGPNTMAIIIIAASAAPTSGVYGVGDICENSAPTRTKNISHWKCINATGSGTWQAYGTGWGTTAERPSLVANDAGYSYFDTTLAKMILWSGTAWQI